MAKASGISSWIVFLSRRTGEGAHLDTGPAQAGASSRSIGPGNWSLPSLRASPIVAAAATQPFEAYHRPQGDADHQTIVCKRGGDVRASN